MELGGLMSKVTSKADLIGVGLGLVAGSTSGIADVQSIIDQILAGQVHAPNWSQTISVFTPFGKQAAITWLAGLVIDELGLPVVGKLGPALQKGAIAYGATSFVLHLLYYSTHANEGCNPIPGQNLGSKTSGSVPGRGYS